MSWIRIAILSICCWAPPPSAYEIDPLPQYRTWWAQTEACVGVIGNFDEVSWYVVPERNFRVRNQTAIGVAVQPYQTRDRRPAIYLARWRATDELVVKHEMVHILIKRAGHPSPPFGGHCGI